MTPEPKPTPAKPAPTGSPETEGPWGPFLRENFPIFGAFIVLLLFIVIYVARRLLPGVADPTQLEFLNDCTNIVLGALMGMLTQKMGGKPPSPKP
jgi:hypothetical protein